VRCSAWPVDKVVDSTGCGDAFIGGVGYGIVRGLDIDGMLLLAARVASAKIGKVGARSGLPRRQDIDPMLLEVADM
jgi:sugar/nucleoside kinase (ribokinase family)